MRFLELEKARKTWKRPVFIHVHVGKTDSPSTITKLAARQCKSVGAIAYMGEVNAKHIQLIAFPNQYQLEKFKKLVPKFDELELAHEGKVIDRIIFGVLGGIAVAAFILGAF